MRHLVRTTKALADETRIRILGALQGRELCVCQLIELLGLAPSTVSKHLSILRNARLINSRKAGRWMYYRLSGEDAPGQITAALEWVFSSLVDSPRYTQDNLRLEEILKIDPEILCSRQPRSAA
ncbi:MAG: metalloregulator ArsR/SmtB family transcription factor [Desulfobacterales bacterium]